MGKFKEMLGKSPEASSSKPPPYEGHEGEVPGYEPPRLVPDTEQSTQLVAATAKFPPTFSCFTQKWSLSQHYLGVEKGDKKFYIKQSLKETWMHDGPDKEAPVLASAKCATTWTTLITLPPRKGHDVGVEVIMEGDHSNRQPFVVAVGSDMRAEEFEWRMTHGAEAKQVGGDRFSYGWKLVRLNSTEGTSSAAGNERATREFGITSDGKEVVAAVGYRGTMQTPVFSFMGTGLTGTLGETWEIVAVMTFIRVVELQTQRSMWSGAPWFTNERGKGIMPTNEGNAAGKKS